MLLSSFCRLTTMTCAGLLFAGRLAQGQSVTTLLPQLLNDNFQTRETAFNHLTTLSASQHVALCSNQASEVVKVGLIAALKKETTIMFAPGGDVGEEEGDVYYPDLLGCVGELRDVRAAPVIADGLETGGIAIGALEALGDAGAAQGVQTLQHAGAVARFSAAMMLGSMAAEKPILPSSPVRGSVTISTATRQAIRSALLASAVGDKNYMVRWESVSSLSPFRDAEVRTTIQRLQAADTDRMTKGADHTRRFDIRRAAHDWLKQDSVRLPAKMP